MDLPTFERDPITTCLLGTLQYIVASDSVTVRLYTVVHTYPSSFSLKLHTGAQAAGAISTACLKSILNPCILIGSSTQYDTIN